MLLLILRRTIARCYGVPSRIVSLLETTSCGGDFFRLLVESSRWLRLLAGFLCYLHLSSQFFVAARTVTTLEES